VGPHTPAFHEEAGLLQPTLAHTVKILAVHNYYQQPGGEDQVFHAETEVLRAHGNLIGTYTLHNDAISSMNRFRVAAATVWNQAVVRDLTDLLRADRPDIIHFHNTFPLVSPSAYSAARQLGIPVVQTLHNFRLLCLNGLFLRDGRVCEDCLGRAVALPGVRHACYRNSRQASAVTATMLGFHRWRGTWKTSVDTYITSSEFARGKFLAGGIPPERIIVKPHFVSVDPGMGRHSGGYALYVGRLSVEKGVQFLAQLWSRLAPGMPLRIIGSGPLEHLSSPGFPNVEWLGWQPREQVVAAMRDAAFLLFPSECYESFGMVLVEAMAAGLPVLANDHGSSAEIVQDGKTGLLRRVGDYDHWSEGIRWALANPEAVAAMGRCGRQEFERRYTAPKGYELLMEAYQRTLDRAYSALPQ
jgi:glycosyltransferase involved in cell wall biosynthesis